MHSKGVYIDNKLWELSIFGNQFYNAETEEQYRLMRSRYREVADQLIKTAFRGDMLFHTWYATLDTVYNGNLYCGRHGKTPLYEIDSLISWTKNLLKYNRQVASFLIGRIYYDLLHDANMAHKYFMDSDISGDEFVNYRIGNYWQDFAKDYEKAITYYNRCVTINPMYYNAWYRLGRCLYKTAQYDNALSAYRKIYDILHSRFDANVLSYMDIEYLFKAQYQCAHICADIMNNPQQAIREDMLAEKVWESIYSNRFFDKFCSDSDKVLSGISNQLEVSVIRREIYGLACKIGDDALKSEYANKD